MQNLVDPAIYRTDPGRGVAALPAARPADRRFLGVLKAVAAWRESAAQQRDLPRGRIMKDEAVLEIAAHAPKTIEQLARTRSLAAASPRANSARKSSTRWPQGLEDPDPPPADRPARPSRRPVSGR